jgi:hypothetical protein
VSRRAGRLLAGAAGLLGLAAASPPSLERAITVDAAGRVAVRLDRDLYEGARADLGDLRVVDGRGSEVPYVVDRGEPQETRREARPAVRNRGWRADGAATAVLDFEGRLPKRRLELRLSGANFRRRVAVEGSDDGGRWTALVDEAWVFAVPGPEPARYESVELPENDFPVLRVVVHAGPDEEGRPAIEDAWVLGEGRAPGREEALAPRWSEARETRAGETWLTLDLGARHQPFTAIELDVADQRFFREVRVEARREPPAPDGGERWDEVGRGQVHRLEHEGRRRECLRVEATGRARGLRLRVRNRDDRPLRVRAVTVRVPVERLMFEAPEPGTYRLTYGSADRQAPVYDLTRTAGDLGTWGRAARPAALGPVLRLAGGSEAAPPWTERHPALLWAGLVVVVVCLGALTWRALRQEA